MGKHFWRRQRDDDEVEDNKQHVGCMWGLVHALDYHHWNSNVRKMRRLLTYETQITPKSSAGRWSPKSKVFNPDAYEAKELIDEKQNPNVSTKSRRSNRRSLKSRIKALISEEISKGSNKARLREGFSLKSNMRRTYSIHHLESLDGKYDKNRITFFARNVENCRDQSLQTIQLEAANKNEESGEGSDAKDNTDVLEIFKVDKELFVKNLRNSDEKIDLNMNLKAKFTKSRSFPVTGLPQRRKLKPCKLENKQREVWSFPKDDRFQEADHAPNLVSSDYFGGRFDDRNVIKRSHRRSSSLNESLEKYARLFENSYRANPKLDLSKTLKLTTEEYFHGSMSFGRIYPLSNVESYFSDLNFGQFCDDLTVNDSSLAAKDTSSGLQSSEEEEIELPLVDGKNVPPDETWIAEFPENQLDECNGMQITENSASLVWTKNNDDGENVEKIKEGAEKPETRCEGTTHKKLHDQCSFPNSDSDLQETVSHVGEFHVSEGLEQKLSHSGELDSSTNYDNSTLNLTSDKKSVNAFTCFEHDRCPKNKYCELCYISHLLDQSGIATVASERPLQESNHPLTPQFFEGFEACWPHDHDQLTGLPDFRGCWHHMMLFHVANEALHEIYDISLPYYPNAMSFSCHVRPFPMGNRIIEAVCKKISTFVPEEKQSLDYIVAHDLANDDVWMNLQYESECIALELEDIIFDGILEDFTCC